MTGYGYEIGAAIRTLSEIRDQLKKAAATPTEVADVAAAIRELAKPLGDIATAVESLAAAIDERRKPRRRWWRRSGTDPQN